MNGDYYMNNLNGNYNEGTGEYNYNYNYNHHTTYKDNTPFLMLFIILFCSLSLNLFRCCINEDREEGELNILLLDKKEITDEKLLDEKCVICLENYQTKEKITRLNCNHTFHYKCLSLWVKTQNTCPLCRFTLL